MRNPEGIDLENASIPVGRSRRWKTPCLGVTFVIILTAVIIIVVLLVRASNSDSSDCVGAPPSPKTTYFAEPDPRFVGQWKSLLPIGNLTPGGNLGIMCIHVAITPSGKIICAAGSSWRNDKNKTQTYPGSSPPQNHKGLWIKAEDPFRIENRDRYYSGVNFQAIYDPVNNTWHRIPHPVPVPDPQNASAFLPTDLFCSGHLHLPNGDILFIGGTQYYNPQRTGTRTTHIFDWKMELEIDWNQFDWTQIPTPEYNPWKFSGLLERGRWYPTLVPLLDGRLVIFGGYVGIETNYPEMYEFEMNPFIEIFDPSVQINETNNLQAAWKNISVKSVPNSPFATPLEYLTPAAFDCDQNQRKCDDYKNDSFKLYPQNYLLPDGRIYLTREGDFISLRTPNAEYMRMTKFTYYFNINGNRTDPTVSFTSGPKRPDISTSAGTTVMDPNGPQILLLGGQPINGGTFLPSRILANSSLVNDTALANQYLGSQGSTKLEVFQLPESVDSDGSWRLKNPNFLGDHPEDVRTMHYALILPTKQILIISGGNYDYHGPVYWPLLLTPIYCDGKFTGNYDRTRMASSGEGRLYHNTAILLSDGRILVLGGNAARAMIDLDAPQGYPQPSGSPLPNFDRVERDLYFFTDSSIARGPNVVPTENWKGEFFSPPYLFIDPGRQVKIEELEWVNTSTTSITYQPRAMFGGKPFYLLHSQETYIVTLSGVPFSCPLVASSLVLIKLGSVTHGWDLGQRLYSIPFTVNSGTANGTTNAITFIAPQREASNIAPGYYHLFFIDCAGKPSVSQIVRFDDSVDQL